MDSPTPAALVTPALVTVLVESQKSVASWVVKALVCQALEAPKPRMNW
jgi:hypothetical protein